MGKRLSSDHAIINRIIEPLYLQVKNAIQKTKTCNLLIDYLTQLENKSFFLEHSTGHLQIISRFTILKSHRPGGTVLKANRVRDTFNIVEKYW